MTRNRKVALAYFVAVPIYVGAAYVVLGALSAALAGLASWLTTTIYIAVLMPLFWLAAKALAAWNNEPH